MKQLLINIQSFFSTIANRQELEDTKDAIKKLTWENQYLTQQLKQVEAEKQQLLQRLHAAEHGNLNYTLGILNNTIGVLAANRIVGYDGMGNPQVEPVIEDRVTKVLGNNIVEDCLKKIKKLL